MMPLVLKRFLFGFLVLALVCAGLSQAPRPVYAAPPAWEDAIFRLTQSTGSYQIWTTLPSEKVYKDSAVPSAQGSEIRFYAAQNEFEPFQVVVKPSASGNVTVSLDSFGSGITAELYQVKYVDITQTTDYLGRSGANPDPLWPLAAGASVALTANENTAFWFSVYVPAGTAAGDYTSAVHLGGISIPVRLHVFNFSIPNQLHIQSQMNFSYQTILTRYGVSGTGTEYWDYVRRINQFMIDHRLTPAGPLWPGGVTSNGGGPFISYDCSSHTLTDTDGIWGFEIPANNYLNGANLRNGVGYPSFMAATFRNNDSSADQRPDTFCGSTRGSGDWYTANNPGSVYNQKWFTYMSALQNYLSSRSYLDKAYYYFANEPQDQADYDAVAWYSKQLKAVAPNLKLMVSEEPKPEIYANPSYPGAKIDIWVAHLGLHFKPEVALERLKNYNEETWIYFLKSTYLPRFNPLTIDHPGAEARFTGWFLWKYRLRGVAYYSFNNWSTNPWTDPRPNNQNGEYAMLYPPSANNANISYGANGHRFVPSIRVELMRDGFEDYEYFYLLNGGQQPQADAPNAADPLVDKIIGGVAAYNRDSEMIYNLRRLTGYKLSGELPSIPDIAPRSVHSRSDGAPGNYYLNFQDPDGQPTGPLVVNGHPYQKIGVKLYDPALGYGWTRASDVPQADFYATYDQWFEISPPELLRSMIINDWGREDVFEYDLPNGDYNVTVGVGYRGGTRHHKIIIEGVNFIDNETTNNSAIIRTRSISVKDKKLTLTMGMYDEVSFINFMDIEAGNPPVTDLRISHALNQAGQLDLDLTWTPPASADLAAVRYAYAPITADNWDAAALLSETLPAAAGTAHFSVPFDGRTLYFSIKTRDAAGRWTSPSNSVFYSEKFRLFPLIRR